LIKAAKPFYRSSGFLKVLFSFLTSAIQSLAGLPLISTPLIDRAITHAYSLYPSMHVATATIWITLSEFLFTALVIWSILHLFGKRTKIIILVGTILVTSVILAKFILR